MKSKWERLERILPYLVLLAAYLLSVGIFAVMGSENLDSDMSSEMVLANLLNEEGKLLSENWYYSTELRVATAVPVYQLGLMLFDSWHMARTFAVAVLLAAMAASYLYLMYSAGFGSAMAYCAAGLILPVSVYSKFLLVYGHFYSVHFILICLLLALVIRLVQGRFNRVLGLLLLLGLSVWGGLGGVRMLMLCAAPLGLTVCVLLFARLCSSGTLREAVRSQEAAYLLWTAVICVGFLTGYLINAVVFASKYSFENFGEALLYQINWEEVFRQINYLPYYFGFVNRQPLISLDGVCNAAAIAVVIVSVLSLFALLRRQRELSGGQRLVVLFTAFSVALGMGLNSMMRYAQLGGGAYTVSYYLPGLLLLVSMAFAAVDGKEIRLKGFRSVALLAMTAVFLLQTVRYVRSDFRTGDADYRKTANYLLDNGYTRGFATFWNANVMTEATDGALEVYTYATWEEPELHEWLQKKEHFEKLPEGKVFVLVDYDESRAHPPLAREENFLCETYSGYLYSYDSAQEVMDIQRGAVQGSN